MFSRGNPSAAGIGHRRGLGRLSVASEQALTRLCSSYAARHGNRVDVTCRHVSDATADGRTFSPAAAPKRCCSSFLIGMLRYGSVRLGGMTGPARRYAAGGATDPRPPPRCGVWAALLDRAPRETIGCAKYPAGLPRGGLPDRLAARRPTPGVSEMPTSLGVNLPRRLATLRAENAGLTGPTDRH